MNRALIAILAFPIALASQQRDARTIPPPPGTGEITGVIWTADAAPQPMRRAVVSISGTDITSIATSIAGTDLKSMRSVITDDRGTFTFSRLSGGTFSITAKKPGYLPAAYGAMKPGRPGSPIALAAGQRVSINVTMFKGAVIAGTLRDAAGLPLAGVGVSVIDARAIGALATGTPSPAPAPAMGATDDRGVYRIYGLMPGEYLISATPSTDTGGEIGVRSSSDLDAVLATLTQRQQGVTTTATTAQPQPPMPRLPSVGYAPIYFPGTAWYTEAATIRVAPGEEREGLNFEVGHVRVSSITGVVSGDVANLSAVELSLIFGGPRAFGLLSTQGITSTPPNARGEFTFGNMPPGQYRIVAKARRGATDAAVIDPGARSFSSTGGGVAPIVPGAGGPRPNVEQLFAIADVEIRGQDITGVGMQLQAGGTISGKVVFDAAKVPVPTDLWSILVQLTMPGGSYTAMNGGTRVGNSLSQVNAVAPNADGTFQIIGIGPGPYSIACRLPAELAKVWKLRSAMVDGRDLLDGLIEGPAIQMTGVTLTLSDKRTELAGTLQSAAGQPTTDYYVIAFATDRAHWQPGSRRSLSARPGTDGRFTFSDLPAGEYFLAALTDLDPAEWQTAAFLEQVAPAGIKIVVGEGEKKIQDLRIR